MTTTELEAIVAKLAKTADGVPVVPGMDVWGMVHGFTGPVVARRRVACGNGLAALVDKTPANPHYEPIHRCYSTREAAEAAKEKL